MLHSYVQIDSRMTQMWVHRNAKQSTVEHVHIGRGHGGYQEVTVTFESSRCCRKKFMVYVYPCVEALRRSMGRRLLAATKRMIFRKTKVCQTFFFSPSGLTMSMVKAEKVKKSRITIALTLGGEMTVSDIPWRGSLLIMYSTSAERRGCSGSL